MASTGEAGLPARVVTGVLLALVAGMGPLMWDATHHDQASRIPVEQLKRRAGEAVLPYATRVNRAVYRATYHCKPTTPQTWATALLAPLSSAVGNRQGILDAEHLRCGFCSQVSFIVSDILSRNGVPAIARGLDGHVVVAFSHNGHDYVADPDLKRDPFVVQWDDPSQLASAVAREYAGYGLKPHGMQRPISEVFTETATDGVQHAPTMRAIASKQAMQLQIVEMARWALVVGGVTLAGLASFSRGKRSRPAFPRPRRLP